MNKKLAILVVLATVLTLATAMTSLAYTQEEIDIFTGPATGVVNTFVPDGVSSGKYAPQGGLVNAQSHDDGTYTFEGKNYAIDYSWGDHCLTGYAATGNCTASGKMPTLYHTVSGPKSMLGKVCLIKGNYKLNNKSGNVNLYDGIYVFEDTGGAAIEYGTDSTMNVPVVDIYRETRADAMAVTADGTIVAEVFILKELK